MTLPFDNLVVFLYGFYATIAIAIVSVSSINKAVSEFKKGSENG